LFPGTVIFSGFFWTREALSDSRIGWSLNRQMFRPVKN
jgi:hypothetical protein